LTLSDWLEKITSQHVRPIDLGLDRVVRVAQAMGFPEGRSFSGPSIRLGCPSILVGGTNGKGSTCAMLESILLQSGYRVAVYNSPHLLRFNERLRINGQEVSDTELIAAFERVEQARAETSLTYFEFTTLAIFDIIWRQGVDVAVLEIGLGGRLDAVNIVDADCSILVSVDLDHQEFLGETREQIGWEKAHIAKPQRPFICADPEPPRSVAEVVKAQGADLWQFGQDFNFQGDRQQWSWAGRGQRRNAMAYPALRGANQLINASAALAALSSLKEQLPVTQGAVRQGFALVELAARFQVLPGQPAVVLDVAHNPHAAGVLAVNLDQMGFFPKTVAVVGIVAGKDAAAIFTRLTDRIDHWCLCSLAGPDAGPRARSAEELAKTLNAALPNAAFSCHDNAEQAFVAAKSMVQSNDRIVVFGSFLTIAALPNLRHVR
jgi:dihydrofolate synthase/folylpolyglutamate synthase